MSKSREEKQAEVRELFKQQRKERRKQAAAERLASKANCAEIGCTHKAVVKDYCLPHYNARKPKLTVAEEMMAVTKLSDDYLTSIAEKPATKEDKVKQTKNYTEIQMFCIANYIKPGPSLIQAKLVVALYEQWSGKENVETSVVSSHFNKWFTRKTISGELFYELNLEPFLGLLEQNLGYLKDNRYVYTGKR